MSASVFAALAVAVVFTVAVVPAEALRQVLTVAALALASAWLAREWWREVRAERRGGSRG